MQDTNLTRLPDENPEGSLLGVGQLFGQYKVLRLLGRGGMGEVYEMEHRVLRTRHAVKLIKQELLNRPDAAQRFEREAQVMARLRHPGIVHVDDFGETDGFTWLRMELIQGGALDQSSEYGVVSGEFNSLDDLLTGEPLPETLVVDLLKQILDGLSYAHEQGVVHRDLKPSNILLQSPSGNFLVRRSSSSEGGSGKEIIPKITDFGLVSLAGADWLQSQVQLTVARSLAHSTGSGQADTDITRLEGSESEGSSTKALMGTYAYMSPEQKKGAEVDHRSDLYAIGLIGFQMLTGEETPGFEMPSEMVEGISEDWDAWCKAAMAPKLGRRFASAYEMMQGLPTISCETRHADPVNVEANQSDKPGLIAPPLSDDPVEIHPSDTESQLASSDDVDRVLEVDTPVQETEFEEPPAADHILQLPGDGGILLMTRIKSGEFSMGRLAHNAARGQDASSYDVKISEDYWLGIYPVTQRQWQSIMADNPSYFIDVGLDCPVENVSWSDAFKFCERVNFLAKDTNSIPEGYTYSLPTEAQWEFACSAGDRQLAGENLNEFAWNLNNAHSKTHDVGKLRSNSSGLYDMLGNVWEWCRDWHGSYPSKASIDPIGPRYGTARICRGGSWAYQPKDCTAIQRKWESPELRNYNIGFRLALTPVHQKHPEQAANTFAKPPPGWTGD